MADGPYVSSLDLELQQHLKDEDVLPLNLKQVREQAETLAIRRALAHADNNVSNTAKLLGVARPTLYTLLSKYAIEMHEDNSIK
ncbi:helix-turn-helix domain-containing protein [Methyloprofundus sp.]|uniref:helix-turn-helix domain-containing protein n=1 Tax=Methyloprofundus sp. TaxID=2020875 RepID=UPI003D0D1A8F